MAPAAGSLLSSVRSRYLERVGCCERSVPCPCGSDSWALEENGDHETRDNLTQVKGVRAWQNGDVTSIEVLTGDPFAWEVRGARSAVAIGVFDGVHLGHQQVLRTLTKRADEVEGVGVALTFDPHPLEFVDPSRAPKLLTSIDERASVMESCGVGIMGVLPFVQIRDLEPHLFVAEILSYRLNAAWVAVGDNFRFGHNRSGDPALLEQAGV